MTEEDKPLNFDHPSVQTSEGGLNSEALKERQQLDKAIDSWQRGKLPQDEVVRAADWDANLAQKEVNGFVDRLLDQGGSTGGNSNTKEFTDESGKIWKVKVGEVSTKHADEKWVGHERVKLVLENKDPDTGATTTKQIGLAKNVQNIALTSPEAFESSEYAEWYKSEDGKYSPISERHMLSCYTTVREKNQAGHKPVSMVTVGFVDGYSEVNKPAQIYEKMSDYSLVVAAVDLLAPISE